MARTYTDDDKARAVALAIEVGPTEASHRLDIPKGSIGRWLTPEDRELMAERVQSKTRAATEASAASAEAKRARLRDEMLDAALEHVAMSRQTLDGKDAQHWMTAGAIALDKVRLELGEVTDRTETRTVDQVTAEVERLAEELGAKA